MSTSPHAPQASRRAWIAPQRARVLALAPRRWGGGGGVAREERVPLALALRCIPERPVHFSAIPGPRACNRGHVRGVEPRGDGGLGHTRLVPAQDEGHDGLL